MLLATYYLHSALYVYVWFEALSYVLMYMKVYIYTDNRALSYVPMYI